MEGADTWGPPGESLSSSPDEFPDPEPNGGETTLPGLKVSPAREGREDIFVIELFIALDMN